MLNTAPTKRLSYLAAAAFTALLVVFPQTASADLAWPSKGYSQAAETVNTLYFVVFGIGTIAVIALIAALARATRTEVDADSAAAASAENGGKAAILGTVLFLAFVAVGIFAFSQTSSAEPSLDGVGNSFEASPLTSDQLKDPTGLKPPKGPSMTVRVNGQQFLWRYTYRDQGKDWQTYSYEQMVIPTGVTVMLDVTSSDVEHSWWVPQLGGSIDAVPGYVNRSWIRVDKPGIFAGHSTTVSGANYASMGTTVIALPPSDFIRWANGKNIEITRAMDALAKEVESGGVAALEAGATPKEGE